MLGRICVFCGSSSGRRPEYEAATARLGQVLVQSGIELVYGGGRVGLMGILANAVLEAGGRAIGVMPQALVAKEIAHTGLTELRVVQSMHERKALMADLADAFILLPGGFGSWDEFCEIITWAQLGIHRKPAGVLNVAGYYDAWFTLWATAVHEGFVRLSHKRMIVVEEDPERLLAQLHSPPMDVETKWANAVQR